MRPMLKKPSHKNPFTMMIIFKNTGSQRIEYIDNGVTHHVLCHPEAQEILTELSQELFPSNVRAILASLFYEILEIHVF